MSDGGMVLLPDEATEGGTAVSPELTELLNELGLGGAGTLAGYPPTDPFSVFASSLDPMAAVSDTTVGELLRDFYNLTGNELLRTQRLLYAAGFYGGASISDIAWGTHDESSFAAWTQAVMRAARYTAAGVELSVEDVLEVAARQGLGLEGGDEGAPVISLTDPAALRSLIDDTARAVLGRKATVVEQRMFVATIHRLQTSAQLAALNVDSSQVFATGEGVREDELPSTPGGRIELGDTFLANEVESWLPRNQRSNIELGSTSLANEVESWLPSNQRRPGSGPSAGFGGLNERGRDRLANVPEAEPFPPDVASFVDTGALPGDTTSPEAVTQPSPEAEAEELLRAQNPAEAGAHDIAVVFAAFLDLLRTGL